MTKLSLIVSTFLMACGADRGGAPVESPEQLVFSPSETFTLSTMAAAERWTRAAGLDVQVGEGGVSVEAQPRVFQPSSGEEICAHTYRHEGRIVIATAPSVACPSAAFLVTHEMGHILARRNGHADDGVMLDGHLRAPTQADYGITAASLELVCELAHCGSFSPEG